jgi:hypothetical protein
LAYFLRTGNLKVLKIDAGSQGIDVREKLIGFHDKHYSVRWGKKYDLPRDRWDGEVPLCKRRPENERLMASELNLIFPSINEEVPLGVAA